MKLYIKNMVCDRCITAVRTELNKMQIPYKTVQLGEVEIESTLKGHSLGEFRNSLRNLGFELIEDKSARQVSLIKKEILDTVHLSV